MKIAFGPLSREQKKRIAPYILIAPVLIYYAAFWLFPVLRAIGGSFMSAPAGEGGIFTFENYVRLFRDPKFYQALFNTAFIVLVSVTFEFLLAFGLALLINMKFHGSSFFLFLALIPMSLPAVAVGAIWQSGLSTYGWLNSFLIRVGIIDMTEKIIFLGGGQFGKMMLIIIVDAWQVIPSVMVILLSGMQGLQPEMLEAGYVFGGNKWKVLRKITIPPPQADNNDGHDTPNHCRHPDLADYRHAVRVQQAAGPSGADRSECGSIHRL